MKSIFLLFLYLLLWFTAFPLDKYPEWFLYPKNYPDCVIGFSFKNNQAKEDAAYMYCLYNHCKMVGYTKDIDISDENYFRKIQLYFYSDNYVYIIDGAKKDSIKSGLIYLDGFCNDVLSKGFVQLFTTLKEYKPESKEIDVTLMPKPGWIQKTLWEEKGFYYGVGLFSSFKNENEAWKRSEEKAIFSILSSIQTEVSAQMVYNNNSSGSFLLNEIKGGYSFDISNIETQERFVDAENELFYTLVRVKKENVVLVNQ